MKDLAINKYRSVSRDSTTGDAKTVSGRDAFEQAVARALDSSEWNLLGETAIADIEPKIRQSVIRIAREYNEITNIVKLSIDGDTPHSDTYRVLVIYNTGDTFTHDGGK